MKQRKQVKQHSSTRSGAIWSRPWCAWFASSLNRSSRFLILALCPLTLVACSIAPRLPPTAPPVPGILPMPPAPRLLNASDKPTAGDLFRLTIELYEYAGECKRRLDAVTVK